MPEYDIAIIGGGIVGLATAYQIGLDAPSSKIVILEKEPAVARHQTGRNSGVLHSGIYYKPGSLKAKNCLSGKESMVRFCEQESIPYALCGKVIVATDESELPGLQKIYERGLANGVACTLIGPEALREIEPHVAGIRAIHVPGAGIVDYAEVARRLALRIQERGGALHLNTRIRVLHQNHDGVQIESATRAFHARRVINCGGLYADQIALESGASPSMKIIPFRGEYYTIKKEAHHLCNGLIYPVPDPSFPFLGVHFTRMIHGGVECGPNAVLAFAREGYKKRIIVPGELWESVTYPGFLNLARKHWQTGMGELWRSFSKKSFVRSLQRLIPAIEASHLVTAPAGVRAQALMPDGKMVDDFMIIKQDRMVHVLNAPSPAATSSLQIGAHISAQVLQES